MRKVRVIKMQGTNVSIIFESSGADEEQLLLASSEVIKENNKRAGRSLTIRNIPRKRFDGNTHIYNVYDYDRYSNGLPTLCYNIEISDAE